MTVESKNRTICSAPATVLYLTNTDGIEYSLTENLDGSITIRKTSGLPAHKYLAVFPDSQNAVTIGMVPWDRRTR